MIIHITLNKVSTSTSVNFFFKKFSSFHKRIFPFPKQFIPTLVKLLLLLCINQICTICLWRSFFIGFIQLCGDFLWSAVHLPSLSFSLSKVIRHKERVDTCRESRHKTFSAILSSTVGNKDKISALKTHNAIYE